jgi:AraC family transcriptional regulator of adaptative response/methylated-DNA-[protein]-cysteine methyltransferase
LHLKGTEFQLSVWERLILIPFGGLINYKQLGNGEPGSRDIGTAVGANPVSYLVPCHRVIRAKGNYDGFFRGNEVKARLLTYEVN